jgi:predicted ribosome quality control (RQC) complex YloA/Tae2 family protein
MKQEIFIHKNQTYSISVGGNKYENADLIAASSSDDVWFHLAGLPSCHVVVKTTDQLPRQVIKRCAYLCKINTKSTKSMPKCEVIYTTIANIQITDIPGAVITHNTKSVSV